MLEDSLWNRAQGIGALHCVASLHTWCEMPFLVAWKCIQVNTSFQEESAVLCQLWKRVLQTVEYLTQKSRAQGYGQHLAGKLHLVAYSDSSGHLINLHVGIFTFDSDYLGLQLLLAFGCVYNNVSYLVHQDVAFNLDGNHVAVHSDNFAAALIFHYITHIIPLVFSCGSKNICINFLVFLLALVLVQHSSSVEQLELKIVNNQFTDVEHMS